MESKSLTLSILPATLAISRLSADAEEPVWSKEGKFRNVTRTSDELSIVCEEQSVPDDVTTERGWKCLKVEGQLDFGLTGILAAVAVPLAQARISIFVMSTFDTDYVLVKQDNLAEAINTLRHAGHTVNG